MSKLIDITGKTFGNYTVLFKMENNGSHTKWKCLCKCGKEAIVSSHYLRYNRSKQCSTCRINEFSKTKRKPEQYYRKEDTGINLIFRRYKNNSKKKNREFSLTKEDFKTLITANCFYCKNPPKNIVKGNSTYCKDFFYNGIDRVNNLLGYTKENSVTCCETCNRAKLSQSVEDFKTWIIKVYKTFGVKK